ncbi:MAG TPA: hypothetical protein VN924_22520 [Bryobacteraceae bacterium]|nr:hypothetical protein [Bryobacteraceae bacterium]
MNWQEDKALAPDDIKTELARNIARSQMAVCRLFTGHRGVGKTTELKRVKSILENGEAGPPVFVSMLRAEQWMDLQDVQAPDIIFHIVRQLVDDLNAAGFSAGHSKFAQFFKDINEQLNREVDLQGLKISAGIVEFATVLKEVPFARATLRKLIEGHLPTIYDLVNNRVLTPAREWLKREQGKENILVIVDELDRIPQRVLNNQGLTNQRNIFVDHAGILRALACPVLYTVPVELAYSDAHVPLKTNYGCNIRFLPLIPVARRDGRDNAEGLRALCRIVHRRIAKAGSTPQQFCEDPSVLEDLCRASGGHIRTLFVLLASAMDRCEELPVTREIVNRTIRRQAIDLSLSLRPAHWEALRKIHVSKTELADDPDLWNALLRNLLAFAYEDESGVWYDWNALLAAVPNGAH